MFCPKCGNRLSDIFVDKCLSCGMSFKNLSLSQRQNVFASSGKPESKRFARSKRPSKSKGKTTEVRVEYNNGYATKEGMSKSGKKFRKGSFKKRPNNEGIGFRFPAYGLGDY